MVPNSIGRLSNVRVSKDTSNVCTEIDSLLRFVYIFGRVAFQCC
jgi:hypothetical protein